MGSWFSKKSESNTKVSPSSSSETKNTSETEKFYKVVVDKIEELHKELDLVKQQKQVLEETLEEISQKENLKLKNVDLSTAGATKAVENIQVGVSNEILHSYVKKLLENENINIKYLPDKVESAIYETIFKVLLNLLSKTLELNSIQILGHKIRVIIEPQKDEMDKEKEIEKTIENNQT